MDLTTYMPVFAWVGIITIYLVIASLVGGMVYKVSKRSGNTKGDSQFLGTLGGMFFPVTIVIGIGGTWVRALIKVSPGYDEEDNTSRDTYYQPMIQELKDELSELKEERKKEVVKETKVIKTPKFKVGDLVTGVSGNPGNYKHLYEGCLCRVLSINEKGSMELILVNHTDYDAHKDSFGKIFKAPSRNFKLKTTTKKNK